MPTRDATAHTTFTMEQSETNGTQFTGSQFYGRALAHPVRRTERGLAHGSSRQHRIPAADAVQEDGTRQLPNALSGIASASQYCR